MNAGENSGTQLVTRRALLRLAAAAAGVWLLQACGPAAQPSPTAAPQPSPAQPAAPATRLPAAGTPAPAATAGATQAPAAATKVAAPKKGGALRIGNVTDVTGFSPAFLAPGITPCVFQVFDTLIHLDDDFKVQPRMAESWTFSPDYLTMTIKLRQGVRFHSGKELTADDVVGTIAFYADKVNTANLLQFASSIKDPKALDRYTVELHFEQVPANVYDSLSWLFIIDPTDTNGLKNRPNGTGPFKLQRWQPNEKSVYSRFEQYRQPGLPCLDGYELSVWPDAQSLIVTLETGTVDCVVGPIAPLEAKRLASSGKYQFSKDKGALVFGLYMNVTVKPLSDKRVRQAISWTIDRQRFCNTYLQGLSAPRSLPWPSFSPAYDANLDAYYSKRDLAKARELLKEAGYENGFDVDLLCTRQRPGSAELAEQVQSDLKEIGIRVRLDVQELGVYNTRGAAGNLQMQTGTFQRSNKTPVSLFLMTFPWRTENNISHFTSDKYSGLVKKLSGILDVEQTKPYLREMNQLLLDECFALSIAPMPTSYAMVQSVKGYRDTLESYPILESAWLDR